MSTMRYSTQNAPNRERSLPWIGNGADVHLAEHELIPTSKKWENPVGCSNELTGSFAQLIREWRSNTEHVETTIPTNKVKVMSATGDMAYDRERLLTIDYPTDGTREDQTNRNERDHTGAP